MRYLCQHPRTNRAVVRSSGYDARKPSTAQIVLQHGGRLGKIENNQPVRGWSAVFDELAARLSMKASNESVDYGPAVRAIVSGKVRGRLTVRWAARGNARSRSLPAAFLITECITAALPFNR